MDYRFSVSMCVYGGDNPVWFKTAAESILKQTLMPDEVVLVVDGPIPEELRVVVRNFEENPIFNVIWLEKNQGHGNARRIGLNNCRYELVAIMDSDDVSKSDRFEKQINYFKNSPVTDVVGGYIAEFVGDEKNIVAKRIVPIEDYDIKKYVRKRCPMNLVSVMFKKSSVEKAGGFIDWYCEEDYYLWIRMIIEGMKFANIDEVFVNVRVGKDMYKRRGGLKYFKSERRLQKYMKKNKIIGFGTYVSNVAKRFIVQVLLPNNIRSWVFRKFARRG